MIFTSDNFRNIDIYFYSDTTKYGAAVGLFDVKMIKTCVLLFFSKSSTCNFVITPQALLSMISLNIQNPTKIPPKLTLNVGARNHLKNVPIKLTISSKPTFSGIQLNSKEVIDQRTDEYDHKTWIEHILHRPENYTGSIYKRSRLARLLNMEDPKNPCFVEKIITLPEAIDDLFREILSNAGDNVQRSREKGVPFTYIDIKMDKKRVVIQNDGSPIPIAKKRVVTKNILGESHIVDVWMPEFLFGMEHTSSNYDDRQDRTTGGRNGVGGKATNIFSKFFMVEVGDPETKLQYKQIWRDNLSPDKREEPEIKPYDGPSFVRVTYELDFKRFGYDEYPDEAIGLFGAYAVDSSFTSRAPVRFNGLTFDIKNIYDFAEWFFPKKKVTTSDTEGLKTNFGIETNVINKNSTIINYVWPEGCETVTRNGVQYLKRPNQLILPVVEMLIIDTPDSGKVYAFCNGIPNRDGGIHSDAGIKAISEFILPKINNTQKKTKSGQQKNKQKTNKNTPKLNLADVRPHLSILINIRIANPSFNNQAKNKMTGYKVGKGADTRIISSMKIRLTDKQLKRINGWNLIGRLKNALRAKHLKLMKATDGKKTKNIDVDDVNDANLAGGRRSSECVLIVSEGKSANAYVEDWIAQMGGTGNDLYGSMPLRGKPLNILNAKPQRIIDNREIAILKQTLGLKECENENERGNYYMDPKRFNSLRYGKILIMADSDVDGKHIVGLILLMFHCLYPSLLKKNFVMFYRTPILRAIKGAQRKSFMTQSAYKQWIDEDPTRNNWEIRYFKGLGSSEPEDVIEDFRNPHIIQFHYDDHASEWLHVAFNKTMSSKRKNWIEQFSMIPGIELMRNLPISSFIGGEMGEHPIANLTRSIPGLDGLKVSQRKIVWACIKRWKGKYGPRSQRVKVASLAAHVLEKTNYHHGPKSLADAIILMAQDFAGSNNLPYMCPLGKFGTRTHNGKNASDPRYIHSKPQWWWSLVYRPEDAEILEYVEDEGKTFEPIDFCPILPMGLINGCMGIATGYSTFIPQYNPLDICRWILRRISIDREIESDSSKLNLQNHNSQLPTMNLVPWYRGFNGTVEIKMKTNKPSNSTPSSTSVSPSSSTSTSPEPSPSIDKILIELDDDKAGNDVIDLDQETEQNAIDRLMGEDNVVFDEISGTTVRPIKKITLPRHSVVVKGKMVKNNTNKITILELPINRAFADYYNWLVFLRKEKKIKSVRNLATPTVPKYEITGISGLKSAGMRALRLVRTFSLTNMVLLNNERKPIHFDNIYEILEHFYYLRLKTYIKRKKHEITKIEEQIKQLIKKTDIVEAVTTGEISTVDYANKKRYKRQVVIEQAKNKGFDDDHIAILKKMGFWNATVEGLEQYKTDIVKKNIELEEMKKSNIKDIWEKEINEFLKGYCKHYKIKYPLQNNIMLPFRDTKNISTLDISTDTQKSTPNNSSQGITLNITSTHVKPKSPIVLNINK